MRDELTNLQHPVDQLATLRADDNVLHKQSLDMLRRLHQRNDVPLTMCGYHDVSELPVEIATLEESKHAEGLV